MPCPPECLDTWSDVRRFRQAVLELLHCILTDTNQIVEQNIRYDWEFLCDSYDSTVVVAVRFAHTTDGGDLPTAAFNVSDGTPYDGDLGDLVPCGGTSAATGLDAEETTFCDDGVQKTRVNFWQGSDLSSTIWIDVLGGAADEPTDPSLVVKGPCVQQGEINTVLLCDDDGAGTVTPFLAHVTFVDGAPSSITTTELDTVTAYTISGTPTACDLAASHAVPDALSIVLLCDVDEYGDATEFLRRIQIDAEGTVTITTTELDGTTAYTPTGNVGRCRVTEQLGITLCDSEGTVFIRYFIYEGTTLITTFDTDLNGVSFSPVGAVSTCTQDDREFIILCDNNAGEITQFLRHIVTSTDGSVVVNDTELDGTTAYTPTGNVGKCCCEADTDNVSPSSSTSSGASSTTAGVYSVSITNTGAAAGTVNGESLPAGMTVTYTGYYDEESREMKRVASINFDASGTTFRIDELP